VSDLPSKSQEVQEFVEMLTSAMERTGSLPEIDEVQHPLATKLPLMSESQLRELAEDIKENGLHTSMVLYERKILEGRGRYLACKLNGRPFTVEDFSLYDEVHHGDPELYVISVNVMRRHLPDDIRTALAEAHWQRIKKKQGRASALESNAGAEEDNQSIDGGPIARESALGAEEKFSGKTRISFREDNFLGKPEKTPAQQKQESRERKEGVAKAYGTTVGAMEAQTRLRKTDPEKAEEVKAGKTTQREAIQQVAEKTGKRRPRKPIARMELKDGLTLAQVFRMMLENRNQKLEGTVKGYGQAIFISDADIQPVREGTIPSREEFLAYATEEKIDPDCAADQYRIWLQNHWKDLNGTPVLNWKVKLLNYAKGYFGQFAKSKPPQRAPLPQRARSSIR
jgi:hypothetical protein